MLKFLNNDDQVVNGITSVLTSYAANVTRRELKLARAKLYKGMEKTSYNATNCSHKLVSFSRKLDAIHTLLQFWKELSKLCY